MASYLIPKYAYKPNTFLINNKYDIEMIDNVNRMEYNFVNHFGI